MQLSTRFNSDENTSLDQMIKQLRTQRLILDGVFFRLENDLVDDTSILGNVILINRNDELFPTGKLVLGAK